MQRRDVHTNIDRKICKEENSWKMDAGIAGVTSCTSLSSRTVGGNLGNNLALMK